MEPVWQFTPQGVRPTSRAALFVAFLVGHLSVYVVSTVLGFLLAFFLLLVVLLGWVLFLVAGVAMLLVSTRRVPRQRWAALGLLTGTAALYGPLVALFGYEALTETQTVWAVLGISLGALTIAAITAARGERHGRG